MGCTKAYIPLALRVRWPHIGPPGEGENAENQQHQRLHCQTIVQCIMLNADVCKGRGWSNVDTCDRDEGRYKNGSFL